MKMNLCHSGFLIFLAIASIALLKLDKRIACKMAGIEVLAKVSTFVLSAGYILNGA
jgi:hypothetical protein